MRDLLENFAPLSKADWLKQIEQDLKGRPLQELVWQAAPGLDIDPLVHAEDFPEPPQALAGHNLHWEICEQVVAEDPATANAQALQALEFGAEALVFHRDTPWAPGALAQALEGIHLDYIGLYFSGASVTQDPGGLLSALIALVQGKTLQGGLERGLVQEGRFTDWRYAAEMAAFTLEQTPGLRTISISAEGIDHPVDSVAALLKQGHEHFVKLQENRLSPVHAAAQIQFKVDCGVQYLLEIARLRAFRQLWLQVLDSWGVMANYPLVYATVKPGAYTDDLYSNMIRATTIAMSAVIGGADRLTVLPYDAGREAQSTTPAAFGRRIARNVQHLLKMESGLESLNDPAAGSYYLESLTRQIATQAWEKFKV